MADIGIAGWLFNRSILRDKTMTLLELPAVCRELGVDNIELVSTFFASQHANYLNQLRTAIADNGLHVQNIAVDMGNIANSDEAVRRTDLEAIKQWFYTALAVGSKAIRVNSGAASPDDEAALKRITDGYRELAKEAEHTGIYLLIENHGGASADPRNIKRFLDGVNSKWFRACPDTGNFTNDTWEQGMEIMSPLAQSCHVKVFTYSPDGKQAWSGRDGGERRYDLKRSLQILKGAGYQGPLFLEGAAPSSSERESAEQGLKYLREFAAAV